MLDWGWYTDHNTKILFLHCLLRANHKQRKWHGVDIPRGSFLTGRKALSKETGLTEQQIRTAIKKLISTNEITMISTNKNSVLAVVKYEDYQSSNESSTSKTTNNPTNEQPAINQQSTTNNNVNNVNNVTKKTRKPSVAVSDDQFYSVENLNTKAWDKWMDFRKIKKLGRYKTLAPANKLAAFSDQAQMDAVINSISNEWSGLFPKETRPTQNQSVVQLAMQKARGEA